MTHSVDSGNFYRNTEETRQHFFLIERSTGLKTSRYIWQEGGGQKIWRAVFSGCSYLPHMHVGYGFLTQSVCNVQPFPLEGVLFPTAIYPVEEPSDTCTNSLFDNLNTVFTAEFTSLGAAFCSSARSGNLCGLRRLTLGHLVKNFDALAESTVHKHNNDGSPKQSSFEITTKIPGCFRHSICKAVLRSMNLEGNKLLVRLISMRMSVKISATFFCLISSVGCNSSWGGSGPQFPATDSGSHEEQESSEELSEPINDIHLEISGLTEDEFRAGQAFVNNWSGLGDELSDENTWTITSIDAASGNTITNYDGSIRISLAHPFDKKNEDYDLLLAASITTKVLGVCVADETPVCEESKKGFYSASPIFANAKRMFFKTEYSALLEDGLILTVISYDSSNKKTDRRDIKFTKSKE